MARKKNVKFIRYFNGYRMLAVFQIDSVLVVSVLFFLTYMVLINSSASSSITLLGALFAGGLGVKFYPKMRDEASKGFLKHWFYANGLWSVKEDKEKFEELNRLDVENYLPEYNDREFYE